MVSTRLIERIEKNWEGIIRSFLESARKDPRLTTYHRADDYDLRLRAEDTVRYLGRWIAADNIHEIAARYETLGRLRRVEGVPLSELVAKLQLLEDTLLRHVQWENISQNPLEIYGELELVRAIRAFFRQVVYNVIRGYEQPARTHAA
ncbi:MAG: hypothetical protein JNK87_07695 [Bryobacterales bacterium]|nr:hypothetical protein [Bryobacterales bacterium]